MTIRKFIKKLFVTIIMIGIVLAAVLKVGYILICKVIVMIYIYSTCDSVLGR